MMKMKRFMVALAFLLALSLLSGCSEVVETPTNVNSPVIQQQAEGKEISEVSEPNQQDQGEEAGSENEQPVENKKEENQTSKDVEKETVGFKPQENAETQENKDRTNAMATEYVPPNFDSIEGFHSWIQNGGVEDEKRIELLSYAKNSSTVSQTSYYRPQMGNGKEGLKLVKIDAYSTELVYRYALEKNVEQVVLNIYVGVHQGRIDGFSKKMKENYELIDSPDTRMYDKYGSSAIKGIEYYHYHYPANDSTTIYWQIGEKTFLAYYYGDYAQINEILPLLELEQVSYKITNNNAVVK